MHSLLTCSKSIFERTYISWHLINGLRRPQIAIDGNHQKTPAVPASVGEGMQETGKEISTQDTASGKTLVEIFNALIAKGPRDASAQQRDKAQGPVATMLKGLSRMPFDISHGREDAVRNLHAIRYQ